MKKRKSHPLAKYRNTKPCKIVRLEAGESPIGKVTGGQKVYTGCGGRGKPFHMRDAGRIRDIV